MLNWNKPLVLGTTPWCAEGQHFIFYDHGDLFQYKFAELVSDNGPSHPVSSNFDFSQLISLRNLYQDNYFKQKDTNIDLSELERLLDDTFVQNNLSLSAAAHYHSHNRNNLISIDYEPPNLTKYDRLSHDERGQPKIETSFALIHYERALFFFNDLKAQNIQGKNDGVFTNGVYCIVAIAACIEAIANNLAYTQQGFHPDYRDKRKPIEKINQSASMLCQLAQNQFSPLTPPDPLFEALDQVRVMRNAFMHAKELEDDIDTDTLTSRTAIALNEQNCRHYLRSLREAVHFVFSQLPNIATPIVTRTNVKWMGDLEVP